MFQCFEHHKQNSVHSHCGEKKKKKTSHKDKETKQIKLNYQPGWIPLKRSETYVFLCSGWTDLLMCKGVTDVMVRSVGLFCIDLIQLVSNFTRPGRTLTSATSPEGDTLAGCHHSSCVRAEMVTDCSGHKDRSGRG